MVTHVLCGVYKCLCVCTKSCNCIGKVTVQYTESILPYTSDSWLVDPDSLCWLLGGERRVVGVGRHALHFIFSLFQPAERRITCWHNEYTYILVRVCRMYRLV